MASFRKWNCSGTIISLNCAATMLVNTASFPLIPKRGCSCRMPPREGIISKSVHINEKRQRFDIASNAHSLVNGFSSLYMTGSREFLFYNYK